MVKFSLKLTYLLITISAFVTLCVVLSRNRVNIIIPTSKNQTYCVRLKGDSLDDISQVKVKKGQSIFFHETSCNSHRLGKITILARQACSVESAARIHPDSDVYLLYSSPGIFKFEGTESDRFLQALKNYTNVHILHLDYESYLNGTIVEKLFKEGKMEASEFAVAHASDVLRFSTMYKYGGIYLDLDVIVLKNLWKLAPNFSGVDTNTSTAIGVMRFSPDGVGHEVAEICLTELKDHFNGKLWGQNGPLLLQRIMLKRCPEAKTVMGLTEMEDCKGFKIYPRKHFYKINWYQRDWLFDPTKMNEMKNVINESEAVHLWNKDTANLKAPVNSSMPIVELAKLFCPKVFKEVKEYF